MTKENRFPVNMGQRSLAQFVLQNRPDLDLQVLYEMPVESLMLLIPDLEPTLPDDREIRDGFFYPDGYFRTKRCRSLNNKKRRRKK